MQVRFPCLAVKCKLSWPDRDDEAKDQQIDTSNYNKHFFSQRYRPTILIKNEKWLKMHQAAAFTSIHNYIQDRWEGNHRVSGNVPHNTASLNSLSYGSRKGSNDLQSLLQVQVAHPQRSICWGQGPHGSDALDAWEPLSFILLVIFQLGALEVQWTEGHVHISERINMNQWITKCSTSEVFGSETREREREKERKKEREREKRKNKREREGN